MLMKRVVAIVSGVIFLAIAAGGFLFRQDIFDWWRLRGYDPPKEVVKLADNTTMNDQSRRLFYVNHPSINNAEEFNANCHIEEFSIILGCYVQTKGIFLYDVKDKRLDGIIEVTAAHEMLHAAYDRLSSDERAEVDDLIVAAYEKLNSKRIKATAKEYEARDPNSVINELHSILGTEVRNLPDELESYYKKYFGNRKKIVEYSEQYEAEFSSRQGRVVQIDRQLASLKRKIESSQVALDSGQQDLSSERAELAALKDQGSVSTYNAAVDDFNEKVADYNELVNSTKSLINKYNVLVRERNALAVEVQDLVEAIDSTPEKFN